MPDAAPSSPPSIAETRAPGSRRRQFIDPSRIAGVASQTTNPKTVDTATANTTPPTSARALRSGDDTTIQSPKAPSQASPRHASFQVPGSVS